MKSGEMPDLARVAGALPPDRMYTFAPVSTYYAYCGDRKKTRQGQAKAASGAIIVYWNPLAPDHQNRDARAVQF